MYWFLFFAALAQAPSRERPVSDTLQSPEVSSDHHVTFRIFAPKASEVTLTGDWLGAAPAPKLSKDERGIWSVTLGPFEPSIYIYSFNVVAWSYPVAGSSLGKRCSRIHRTF